ncbi:MAG: hypothetical protein H6617_05210 [Bdellovibrionaceae bacterium]|nr:hypothetical protein [Pseudobdellovibrionaceae bacterium]
MNASEHDPKSLKIFLVLAFLWGVFGLVVTAHAEPALPLSPPGFENQAQWQKAVQAVVEKKDATVLLSILQVGDGRLDGYFSTNYAHYLQEIAQKQTELFLKVAAEHHKKDWKAALKYLVNESQGLPRNLERAMERIPKKSPEYSHAQVALKVARGEAKKLGKE